MLVDFARGLADLGIELFSTGGTEALLRENGVAVRGVQELTSFPEILGGRVKTLHPLIYAGILSLRGDPGHAEEMERVGAMPIDIVVSNLYPFRETARGSGQDLASVLESIDIGGVTLLRAAAKNFAYVVPVCDPMDYGTVLDELARRRRRQRQPGHPAPAGGQGVPALRRLRHPHLRLPADRRRAVP